MIGSEYTFSQICEVIHGKSIQALSPESRIRSLVIDSRKILSTDGAIFFAIVGARNDGHNYLADLYKKGLRNFVVSKPIAEDELKDANVCIVDDTLKALQLLAAHHRMQFSCPVLAITGSNGKTIIKEWLYQLLREDYNIVRSPKSFNSQVGVPLSVLQMNSENELGIFEAGISQPGEMENLRDVILPTIGIFTNVGQAHNENFKSIEQKVEEKLKIFGNVSRLIYCKDYKVLEAAIKDKLHIKHIFSWSRKQNADLLIAKISKSETVTEIQGVYKNDFKRIKIPFTDEASIENTINCWAFMLSMNIPDDVIASRMMMLSPVAMRLELKEGINNCSIINDTYNSDLGSLGIALDFLKQQKQHERKTLILSDILQSGKDEKQLYTEVAELVNQKEISKLIGVGDAIYKHASLFTVPAVFFHSTNDFIRQFNAHQFHNETILIKGARAFGFEDVSRLLQQKAHETVLEINLTALINNVNYFRSKLRHGTKIMGMVKAFSYGSGSFEIANVLQYHHVDYLAVAYADEGVELRKAGIQLPIMVMNPEEQSYAAMLKYNLEPEIFSLRVLNLFLDSLRVNDVKMEVIPIHIKVDTGMHRLGFIEEELNELIVRIKNNKQLYIRSIFSHLAASDEADHDDFTREQIKSFDMLSGKIASHFDYAILRHILNSNGISRFPDAQFDMVRLGIGMYGISGDPLDQLYLQNVSTLKTTISQIKTVTADKTVGYSRKGKLNRDTRIATVPIGYADGLSRKFGNGNGFMIINDQPAPTIGNICMDMCMLDITDIVAKEGEEVIVFGEKKSIMDVAREMDTIPYEVLTGISRRVKRVYYQE